MSDMFRFVIIGSGNIAETYNRAVSNCDGIEIAGLVSRSGTHPEWLSSDAEVADALEKITVPFDGVILATPNGLHYKGAAEAASLGKHVLTEKVLDITAANMDAMMNACSEAGIKLGVAFQRRMSPDYRALKKLLDEKALGRIYAADLYVKFYRDMDYYNSADYRGGLDIDGGGPFMQQAAHNVDIYTWFFGMPDKMVSMLGTLAHDIEGEDHGTALLSYSDGMLGVITASTSCRPGYPGRMEIHAEKGSVIIENDIITAWDVEGVDNPSDSDDFNVHSGAGSAAVAETAGHEAILSDFVQAVREDRNPAVTAESARKTTELILRIYGSNTV